MHLQAKFGRAHPKERLMVPVVVICVTGLALLTATGQSKTSKWTLRKPSKLSGTKRAVLKAPEIANYKKWQVVNQHEYPMPAEIAVRCAPGFLPSQSSHPSTKDKFIRVFVNEKGRKAMFQAEKPRFSEGSVIVKEKLSAPGSTKAELLTVMIKRRAGYDPKKGDWEYLVTDGAGKKVYERGKINNCQRCHVTQAANDYVFRPYVTFATASE
ncbi:MAG TPA: cytochrome P460 family protein [Abditibacteriaceae bacterium]|jgi:hypothetical protein